MTVRSPTLSTMAAVTATTTTTCGPSDFGINSNHKLTYDPGSNNISTKDGSTHDIGGGSSSSDNVSCAADTSPTNAHHTAHSSYPSRPLEMTKISLSTPALAVTTTSLLGFALEISYPSTHHALLPALTSSLESLLTLCTLTQHCPSNDKEPTTYNNNNAMQQLDISSIPRGRVQPQTITSSNAPTNQGNGQGAEGTAVANDDDGGRGKSNKGAGSSASPSVYTDFDKLAHTSNNSNINNY